MSIKKQSLKRYLQQMVKRIVRQFRPQQVILFGSHAYGNAGFDSDVDLLVVFPVRGSKRNKAIEIGIALSDIPVSKDTWVTMPEEFEWEKMS